LSATGDAGAAPAPKGGGAYGDRGATWAVEITVDGARLELKEFLHDVVGGAVDGLLSGLRGVDRPTSIRIDARRLR